MNQKTKVQTMSISALLCAIGIVIPMIAPKIVVGPASFTLASHVPVFIAMFISPIVSIVVSLVTGIGFLIAGFPPVIVLRALSHIIFALIGAFILKKNNHILLSPTKGVLYGAVLSLIHGVTEVLVVTWFYFGGQTTAMYENGYFISVIVLVGLGTFVHSMVDLGIAIFVWKPLQGIIQIPYNGKVARSHS